MAAKPKAPANIECVNLSVSGDIHKIRCDVTSLGGGLPEKVILLPFDDRRVEILGAEEPATGVGEWFITLKMPESREIGLVFEFQYDGSSLIKVGGVYSPPGSFKTGKGPGKGRVVEDLDTGKVQEYPSK